jgi:hypothetical protein
MLGYSLDDMTIVASLRAIAIFARSIRRRRREKGGSDGGNRSDSSGFVRSNLELGC